MEIYLAYDFYGGGACPTQFYWHNFDKTKWYYFRYRYGHWFLKEGPDDIDSCDYSEYKIIVEGFTSDNLDGFCTRETFLEWLENNGITLRIKTELKEFNDTLENV